MSKQWDLLFIIALFLAVIVFCFEQQKKLEVDVVSKQFRKQIMMDTCFHEGLFQPEIYGCVAFKKELTKELNNNEKDKKNAN